MKQTVLVILALVSMGGAARAVETKTWLHSAPEDFTKGTLSKLSLRSDGRLFLAPVSEEVLDSSLSTLWAMVEDSRGNVYAGGGGPGTLAAKVFRIAPSGESSTVAELEGLEIQALAVNAKDEVFAATSPDGAVYRIANDKPELFFKPKAKYIWALAVHPGGDLFVATGDQGEIFRVKPDGTGAVFFRTEETHVRSLAVDPQGNLVAGTEPGGLILRVTAAGEGFVLYQSEKREVVALAVSPEGVIYSGALGSKSVPPAVPAPAATPVSSPAAQPPPAVQGQPGGAATSGQRVHPVPVPMGGLRAQITGGSELIRVDGDGYPQVVWSDNDDLIYSVTIDAEGRPVFGTGNEGRIYSLDSERRYTRLVKLPPSQVTAVTAGRGGRVYAATSNIGKVYRIGPGIEHEGTYESEVLDAERFSYWGRINFRGEPGSGEMVLETRSGNLDRPQQNWSPWTKVDFESGKASSQAPPARFLQYKLTLRSADESSPSISSVEVAYLHKNAPPLVKKIEATPPNYRFPPQTLTITQTKSLTLPAMTESRRSITRPVKTPPTQTMQAAKGFVGVRWLAEDPNEDSLCYRVEIRGAQETEWKVLEEDLDDDFISWDSTAFADGEYRVRITASDAPSNPPRQALDAAMVSEPFLIDNTPPAIDGLAAANGSATRTIRWKATDANTVITKAEYSVDGGEWTIVAPVGRLSDSRTLEYELRIEDLTPGEHTIAVRATDSFENVSVAKIVVR